MRVYPGESGVEPDQVNSSLPTNITASVDLYLQSADNWETNDALNIHGHNMMRIHTCTVSYSGKEMSRYKVIHLPLSVSQRVP